jgi:hypothetical protein
MAKLIFEDSCGNQFFVATEGKTILLKFEQYADYEDPDILTTAKDIPALIEFITAEVNKAKADLDNETQD